MLTASFHVPVKAKRLLTGHGHGTDSTEPFLPPPFSLPPFTNVLFAKHAHRAFALVHSLSVSSDTSTLYEHYDALVGSLEYTAL